MRKNGEVHFRYIKRNIKRKRTEWKTVAAEKIFDRVFGREVISPGKGPLNKQNQARQRAIKSSELCAEI